MKVSEKRIIVSHLQPFATAFFCFAIPWMMSIATPRQAIADLTISQNIEDFQSATPTPPEQLKIYVSGNRIRIDQGQKISSVILKDKKVTYSIMHETRQYIVLPHLETPSNPEHSKSTPQTLHPDDYTVESTGKTEQIHGFTCKQVRIKESDGTTSDLFISNQALDVNAFYKEFAGFMEFGLGALNKQLENHPELKGIPIRVSEFRDSKKLRESTITRIETSKILDSIFEVPAGYSEIKNDE
jgi:hypothetical protein